MVLIACMQQEADLLTHQKSKHFKCPNCAKRLGSARALSIHCLQVHKTGIQEVPEAKEGRQDPKWEIVGSVGIPLGMVRGGPCPPRVGGSSHNGPSAAVRPRIAYPPYPTGGGMMPPPVYGGGGMPVGAPPPPPAPAASIPYYGGGGLYPPASLSSYGRPHVPAPVPYPAGGVAPPPRPPPPAMPGTTSISSPPPPSSSSQQQHSHRYGARSHQYVSAPAQIHRKPTRAPTQEDNDEVVATPHHTQRVD